MAKGKRCPKCGNATMHEKKDGYWYCSVCKATTFGQFMNKKMCRIFAVLAIIDVFVPDPIPYIDEIILIGVLFKCPDIRSKLVGSFALVSEVLIRIP